MKHDGDIYVALDVGPPKRRFWIERNPADGPAESVRGWVFQFEEWRDGAWLPGWDTWERWFCEIIRYPQDYASAPLMWRRFEDSEVVDLDSLQEAYDGVRVSPSDPLPEMTAADLMEWVSAHKPPGD